MGKFLLVVALFALVVYAGFWLAERRRLGRSRPPRPTLPTPRRQVAPDDDEDFLRELERRRRRAAREKDEGRTPKKPEGGADGGAGGAAQPPTSGQDGQDGQDGEEPGSTPEQDQSRPE